MAKIAAKNLNFSYGGTALEAFVENATLNIRAEAPVSTGLGDAGPRRVVGNYDFDVSVDGTNDFAAGGPDRLFGINILAGTKADFEFDPTGGSVDENNPHYDPTTTDECIIETYSVTARLGEAIKFSATVVPNTALTRTVS